MFYNVILRDSKGYEISSREAEGLKKAKESAKYLASEDYARVCESSHETMDSSRVEVVNDDGECVWDMEVAVA